MENLINEPKFTETNQVHKILLILLISSNKITQFTNCLNEYEKSRLLSSPSKLHVMKKDAIEEINFIKTVFHLNENIRQDYYHEFDIIQEFINHFDKDSEDNEMISDSRNHFNYLISTIKWISKSTTITSVEIQSLTNTLFKTISNENRDNIAIKILRILTHIKTLVTYETSIEETLLQLNPSVTYYSETYDPFLKANASGSLMTKGHANPNSIHISAQHHHSCSGSPYNEGLTINHTIDNQRNVIYKCCNSFNPIISEAIKVIYKPSQNHQVSQTTIFPYPGNNVSPKPYCNILVPIKDLIPQQAQKQQMTFDDLPIDCELINVHTNPLCIINVSVVHSRLYVNRENIENIELSKEQDLSLKQIYIVNSLIQPLLEQITIL
jgi:hypothetical protein